MRRSARQQDDRLARRQCEHVATDKFEDLIASGVVDPTKVTRSALQNAASISGLLLTTECLITEIPEKKEAPAGGHGHGPGGGMDY